VKRVLVTGGTGYVGSHVAVDLARRGHAVTLLDNLSHSSIGALARIHELTDRKCDFVEADIRHRDALVATFDAVPFDSVVHCAALKSVAESVSNPRAYYDNNVHGTLVLLDVMGQFGCTELVFSSSATVYDPAGDPPFDEEAPAGPVNPYGKTKLVIENMLEDIAAASDDSRFVSLRYFNPVGAHGSAKIGEDPNTDPSNLMPRVLDVALGAKPSLDVYGTDYDTPDGTTIRDYIHIADLAAAHTSAIERVDEMPGHTPINIGTGLGTSVFELIEAVRDASGRDVPSQPAPRRAGDVARSVADPRMAHGLLDWRSERSIADMAADAWRWRVENPAGFPVPA